MNFDVKLSSVSLQWLTLEPKERDLGMTVQTIAVRPIFFMISAAHFPENTSRRCLPRDSHYTQHPAWARAQILKSSRTG